jgi:uncharacterized protein DUF4350
MTTLDAPGRKAPAFSPKVILALILVGVFSFSAFAVLFAYAPDLRNGSDGGAHALSKSAVGFAGATVLLNRTGAPTVISRSPSAAAGSSTVLVLTPSPATDAEQLAAFGGRQRTLIVLPKWGTAPDPMRPEWVRKAGVVETTALATAQLKDFAKATRIGHRGGQSSPVLRSRDDGVFAPGTTLALGQVDRLQTLSGEGWEPVLVDEQGGIVLATAPKKDIFVLADPDLLNTQGLRSLDTARAAVAIIDALRLNGGGVAFDVTLNGFERGRSLLKTMLEPPLVGATLCAVAAAILAGLHALVRFGPAARRSRAIALGKTALVDNSAALVRMAKKEPQLLAAYAELTQALAAKAAGGHAGLAVESRTTWLAKLARVRRTGLKLEDLMDEAGRAKGRPDTLSAARRLHEWRLEVTRERE